MIRDNNLIQDKHLSENGKSQTENIYKEIFECQNSIMLECFTIKKCQSSMFDTTTKDNMLLLL